jgi:hypothetical protein
VLGYNVGRLIELVWTLEPKARLLFGIKLNNEEDVPDSSVTSTRQQFMPE